MKSGIILEPKQLAKSSNARILELAKSNWILTPEGIDKHAIVRDAARDFYIGKYNSNNVNDQNQDGSPVLPPDLLFLFHFLREDLTHQALSESLSKEHEDLKEFLRRKKENNKELQDLLIEGDALLDEEHQIGNDPDIKVKEAYVQKQKAHDEKVKANRIEKEQIYFDVLNQIIKRLLANVDDKTFDDLLTYYSQDLFYLPRKIFGAVVREPLKFHESVLQKTDSLHYENGNFYYDVEMTNFILKKDDSEVRVPGAIACRYQLTPDGFKLETITVSNYFLQKICMDDYIDDFSIEAVKKEQKIQLRKKYAEQDLGILKDICKEYKNRLLELIQKEPFFQEAFKKIDEVKRLETESDYDEEESLLMYEEQVEKDEKNRYHAALRAKESKVKYLIANIAQYPGISQTNRELLEQYQAIKQIEDPLLSEEILTPYQKINEAENQFIKMASTLEKNNDSTLKKFRNALKKIFTFGRYKDKAFELSVSISSIFKGRHRANEEDQLEPTMNRNHKK